MTRFGRASRTMDLLGLALLTMMMVILWVQHSALAADTDALAAPDAVGAVETGVGTTGPIAPAGVEHL